AALGGLRQVWQQAGLVLDAVDLVDHQHHRDAGLVQRFIGGGVFLVPAAGLDHQHGRIHAFQRAAGGAVHPAVHGGGAGLAVVAVQAGGVDERHLPGGKAGDAQQPVAGGLRPVGDDADLGADKGVDQGRFADVGTADDGDVAGAVGGGIIHADIVGPHP